MPAFVAPVSFSPSPLTGGGSFTCRHRAGHFSLRRAPPRFVVRSCASAGGDTLLDAAAPVMERVLTDSRLAGCELGRMYRASEDGWDNDVFFEKNELFDGVPTLLLGRTASGRLFGGYNAVGFARRDDYRDSVTCVLFSVDSDGELFLSKVSTRQGSSAIMDFGDCAVCFGAAALKIPMNKRKHLIAENRGTSALGSHYTVLENGESSLFGGSAIETLAELETFTDSKFVREAADIAARKSSQPSLSAFFSGIAQRFGGGSSDSSKQ